MKIIKNGDDKWQEKEIWWTCAYCECKFSGTVKDGDFSIVNDASKMNIAYQGTCPKCGNKCFIPIKY